MIDVKLVNLALDGFGAVRSQEQSARFLKALQQMFPEWQSATGLAACWPALHCELFDPKYANPLLYLCGADEYCSGNMDKLINSRCHSENSCLPFAFNRCGNSFCIQTTTDSILMFDCASIYAEESSAGDIVAPELGAFLYQVLMNEGCIRYDCSIM